MSLTVQRTIHHVWSSVHRMLTITTTIAVCAVLFVLTGWAGIHNAYGQTASGNVISITASATSMQRRPFADTSSQPTVFLTISRSDTNRATLVLFNVDYYTVSGRRLTTADVQQDWGTTQLSLDNGNNFTNFVLLDQGQRQAVIPLLPGRMNFRNNENRILVVNILPYRSSQPLGQPYQISMTNSMVAMTLLDTASGSSRPFLVNGIQNVAVTAGTVNLMELEPPRIRADGLPSRVFANENGAPLLYSVTSVNPNIVRAETIPGELRDNRIPGLRLTGLVPGITTIILLATDVQNRSARTTFDVTVRPNTVVVTSIAAPTADVSSALHAEKPPANTISIYPNPASDRLEIEGFRERSTVRIFATDGREVITADITASHWTCPLASLPSGVYAIMISTATGKSVHRFVRE